MSLPEDAESLYYTVKLWHCKVMMAVILYTDLSCHLSFTALYPLESRVIDSSIIVFQ